MGKEIHTLRVLPGYSRKFLFGLPALLMAAGIFYASSLENIDLPLDAISFNDLLFHFAAYFLFGLTLLLAAYPWHPTLNYPFRTYTLLIVIGILYGLSDEIHQAFVPHRTFALADLAADALGVFFAQILAKTWTANRQKGLSFLGMHQ